MLIGVGVLALLAAVMAGILFLGGDGAASGSPTPSPTASVPAGSESPAPSASSSAPSPSASLGTPTATPAVIAADTIVETTVDRLSLRADPGTDATRLGSLELGARNFVVAGPTTANGYSWYQVSALGLPPSSGCAGDIENDPFNCPFWFGWIAAADTDGTPWVTTSEPKCPAEPITATDLIVGRTNLQRLACLGSDPITFRAWWPEIPPDAGLGGACAGQDEASGWLYCQNINYTMVTIDESEGFGGVGVRISVDPASGVAMPERGTWVEVRVHLDDPAAQGCDEAAAAGGGEDRPPEQVVLDCRAEMVLESANPVDGP
jgi:hypothetical protein